MTLDVFHAVTVLVVQCFLASYVLLLLDFREPRRRWRRCWEGKSQNLLLQF